VRRIIAALALSVVSLATLGSELPQVLQPNATAYSAEEVLVLIEAMAPLEQVLSDGTQGSRRTFVAGEWQSRDFAAYTAGRLAELGYKTLLASQSGWPDGEHVWVLVGLALPARTAWVPVEAAPQPESSQQTLGRVPGTVDEDGSLWFEERYAVFGEAGELPENQMPVAKFRCSFRLEMNRENPFRAVNSYDPDGEIVLYQWDFGDGSTATVATSTVRHEFDETGFLSITLTVIDNAGKSASARVTRRVVGRQGCATCS